MAAKARNTGWGPGLSFISEQPPFKPCLPSGRAEMHFRIGSYINREPSRVCKQGHSIRSHPHTGREHGRAVHACYRHPCNMLHGGDRATAEQAIDRNDYQATHIIIYSKQEPIGSTTFDGSATSPRSSVPDFVQRIATHAFLDGRPSLYSITLRRKAIKSL